MSKKICRKEKGIKNVRYQYWVKHIEAWQRSDLTQEEYSQKVGINYGTFKWWRGQFKKNNSQFLPVRIIQEKEEDSVRSSEIEIRLPGSLSVIIKRDFEEDFLKRVIKSLGSCHV